VLTNGAGVEDDGVRVFRAVHERHAGAGEHAGHDLRVGHVHLAAVGFEEDGLHGGRGGYHDAPERARDPRHSY